jgi:serine/threonine protein kinase
MSEHEPADAQPEHGTSPTVPHVDPSAATRDLDATVAIEVGRTGVSMPGVPFAVPERVGQNGKFVILERIGQGGMGTVFRAADTSLQRDVAIKFLLPTEALTSADVLALCVREARAIARMDHENIVRVYELDDKSDPPFIVMEYLRGYPLDVLIKKGRFEDAEALRVMLQIARGVEHAHKLGVLHRDLKPSNVLLLDTGAVKLLDFGLARLNSAARSQLHSQDIESSHTVTFPLIGTAAYMAPEQWRGREPDARTDIWAAFVVLFELLTGNLPYTPQSIQALASQVTSPEPTPKLRRLRDDLPADFLDWFDRHFDKDPDKRCQTAEELVERLSEFARRFGGEPARVETPPADELWTDVLADGSALHRADRRSPLAFWQKALLLFLAEPDGGEWGAIPELTLRAARLDLDTAVCTLEPDPGDPTWIAREAERLRDLLEGDLKRHRHVIIVARERGAGVVERLLVDALAAVRAPDAPRPDPRDFVWRVRQIIRVGESAPISGPTSARRRSAESAEIDRFDRELRKACRELQDAYLPYPVIHAIAFSSARRAEPDPASAIASRIAPLLAAPAIMIAREAIAQTFELDCAGKIQLLVDKSASDAEKAAPTIAVARTGAQAEICRTLLDFAQRHHREPPCLVVTGDAGVGKSTTLRHLTRRFSGDYLGAPRGGAHLALFVPLYLVTLEGEDTPPAAQSKGEYLLERLLDWWCRWAASLTVKDVVSRAWIEDRLASDPTLLVLDGVDEFLTNNPSYGPADVKQMLAHLRARCANNHELCVILGVRSTQPSLLSLASEPSHVYEILRLTNAQVQAFFPGARAWMDDISDAQLKRLLLTPLLLVQLDARVSRPTLGEVTTRSEVLERVLLTVIEQSGLDMLPRPNLGPARPAQWVLALMLVAWRMFARLRGEIAIEKLREEAQATIATWERHLARDGHFQQAVELSSSFALLIDPQTCDALLRRTVLWPSGQGEVRFIHREWQDFLTARYLAECLRYKHVDELGHFAFTLPMFLAAGEMLGTMRIEEDLVQAIQDRMEATGEVLIHANFCAVLGNSRTPMSERALDLLLGDLRRMPLLSRLVTLASFGARAMRGAPTDHAVAEVRQTLVRGMLALVSDERMDALSRSLAWCNLKALHHVHGTEPPPIPWPGLGDRPEDEDAPLDLLCYRHKTPMEVAPRHRSLQLAWVQIQTMILVAPHRPISGAHYLYTLVVCKKHGVHIPEVTQELPAVFAESSPIALGYKNYAIIPEVWTLFLRCREIFNG